jgi:hypothetical protein
MRLLRAAPKSRDNEATKVIDRFKKLHAREQRDIINFLRSLESSSAWCKSAPNM